MHGHLYKWTEHGKSPLITTHPNIVQNQSKQLLIDRLGDKNRVN